MTVVDGLTMTVWPGREIRVTEPRPADIAIETIAHGLARQCRWNGHTTDFYSVAQHAVLVSKACPPEAALWGLLHDAAEAYLGDVVRPLRLVLPYYGFLEAQYLDAIAAALGLPREIPDAVWVADDAVQEVERRDLLPHPDTWAPDVTLSEVPQIVPWPSNWAKARFLAEFYRLQRANREVARG